MPGHPATEAILIGQRPASGLSGMTLVETLVVIAVIGGLSGLLLTGVQSAREAARAATCRNHLRNVALATLHFEAARGMFPAARLTAVEGADLATSGGTSPWLIRILPFLDGAGGLLPWNDGQLFAEQSERVREHVVDVFLCPSRRGGSTAVMPTTTVPDQFAPCGCFVPGYRVVGGALADYAGNHGDVASLMAGADAAGSGVIVASERLPGSSRWRHIVRLRDVTDGAVHTILCGELHVPRDGLIRPPDSLPAYDAAGFTATARVGGPGVPLAAGPDDVVLGMGLYAFGSWHPRACMFAFADGRVGGIAVDTPPDLLERLCNRHDGHVP
jgi:prepilin-type processing-associated H-X9-DG protein